jgi:homoserine kinase
VSVKPAAVLRLKLPATSANLGPGFDAAGLALSMHLHVEAHAAQAWGLEATGRDAELCSAMENNLIVATYERVLQQHGRLPQPLALKLHNEIPLGMGCGSSAAAICAGVALANAFGALLLDDAAIVRAATDVEGHPDNVAACWLGGFTTSAQAASGEVFAATFAGNPAWPLLLALQPASLATIKARALLPATYSRADAVFNLQRSALLTAAFAQNNVALLREAMRDRMHQPYREQVCPLLGALLPLAEEKEIAGVALSGAGPSVLVIAAPETSALEVETRMRQLVPADTEILHLRIGERASVA